jgi:hypothetical protein
MEVTMSLNPEKRLEILMNNENNEEQKQFMKFYGK